VEREVWLPWEFAVEVKAVLKVAESFVKAPHLHMVSNPIQPFVPLFNLSDDGVLVCFEFAVMCVVAVILLDFCKGSRVVKGMGHLSQGVVGPTTSIE